MCVYVCVYVYVRPFADSPDQQISDQTIISINQLTQHHNHNILNSTHSSLNTYSIEQQATTKVINSETTPAGTKHYDSFWNKSSPNCNRHIGLEYGTILPNKIRWFDLAAL